MLCLLSQGYRNLPVTWVLNVLRLRRLLIQVGGADADISNSARDSHRFTPRSSTLHYLRLLDYRTRPMPLLALFCAFATNLGFLLKHRGACAAPDGRLRPSRWPAPVGLFRSPSGSRSAQCSPTSAHGCAHMGRHGARAALARPAGHLRRPCLPRGPRRAFLRAGLRARASGPGVGLTALGLVLSRSRLPLRGDGADSGCSVAAMVSFESRAAGDRHASS